MRKFHPDPFRPAEPALCRCHLKNTHIKSRIHTGFPSKWHTFTILSYSYKYKQKPGIGQVFYRIFHILAGFLARRQPLFSQFFRKISHPLQIFTVLDLQPLLFLI